MLPPSRINYSVATGRLKWKSVLRTPHLIAARSAIGAYEARAGGELRQAARAAAQVVKRWRGRQAANRKCPAPRMSEVTGNETDSLVKFACTEARRGGSSFC